MTFASQLMLGMQAATAVVGYIQQSEAADAQESAVQANYAQQQDALNKQYDQTQQQAKQQVSERAREAMVERARLRVFAGEAGVAGVSSSRIEGISQMREGTDIATIESNRKNTLDQLYQEGKGVRAQNQSRLNSINRPSLLGTGLQIAGSVAGAATEQERLKRLDKVGRMAA
jgi:hypothetical protein